MKVIIQMLLEGKHIYGYECGPWDESEGDHWKYWDYESDRDEARVHDLEDGELTFEMICDFVGVFNDCGWDNEQLITRDAKTDKPLWGYCFQIDDDDYTTMGRFKPEVEE